MFGVPECLLSDRGANLLSHLMIDLCELLGIKKLNTTSYHPQCNGMVERFNRTLKTMLRKHAGRFGLQWDRYLSGVLWAYRNTPHESTGEKLSFLLFGMDCPSEDLPPGYYWYGRKQLPGNPPRWVEDLMQPDQASLSDSTLSVGPVSDPTSTSPSGRWADDSNARLLSDCNNSTTTKHAEVEVDTDCHDQTQNLRSNRQEESQSMVDGSPQSLATNGKPADPDNSTLDPTEWNAQGGPIEDHQVEE